MRKKSIVIALVLAASVLALCALPALAAYPEKPIHIVNYVAPGGLMDVTSRKFVEIAKKYTKATFVVENKTGAGGLVGMNAVLEQPADGRSGNALAHRADHAAGKENIFCGHTHSLSRTGNG